MAGFDPYRPGMRDVTRLRDANLPSSSPPVMMIPPEGDSDDGYQFDRKLSHRDVSRWRMMGRRLPMPNPA